MKKIFSILIKEHPVLGLVFYPYLIELKDKDHYTVEERLTLYNIESQSGILSQAEIKLIGELEEYSDKNLLLRFSKQKNIPVHLYIQGLDPDYLAKHIRPFIERQMVKCLSVMEKVNARVFLYKTRNVVYKNDQVIIDNEEAEIIFNFIKKENETFYFQTIFHKNKTIELNQKNGIILTNNPCLLLLENHIYRFRSKVDGNKLKVFFDKDFISIPAKFEEDYYKTFVRNCIRDFRVNVSGIEIIEKVVDKSAVLSLENDIFGLPCFFLRFRYGKLIVDPIKTTRRYVTLLSVDPVVYEALTRDGHWEEIKFSFLASHGLKQLRENNYTVDDEGSEPGQEVYSLFSWVNKHYRELRDEGFEIPDFYENKNYYTGHIELNFDITEKNDWFDIYAVAVFGDEFRIPFIRFRKNLINGIREFILPDGRVAILPEEWFSKYTDLLSFGDNLKGNIRVRKFHLPVLEHTFSDKVDFLKRVYQSLENNRSSNIDLPLNIQADLRPYQVDGYKWLVFLRNSKLGGCLADDMGLGKTLQTLCLLSEHIERQNPDSILKPNSNPPDLFSGQQENTTYLPSLVIMPASLIHNWINEIRKFAGHLKFLNYTGPQRDESNGSFNKVPLILTTYGTVRNDYEIFDNYVFDYIILDESQVIKNPSAKIARIVRKLKSNYRLILSGTPIENSLTDLWSQMTFLNPGLLGDLGFFRKFFLKPIEKEKNQEKLEKLGSLVAPFILRRTKAQVEKELPELSEEVIYCEMDPGQMEMYEKEKIQVRNLLLENLEKETKDNAAIYILKALGRLRQIACHPVMADESGPNASGKFREVIRNLDTLLSEGHKVLVFSSFVKHLEIYRKHLEEKGISYSMLTGSSVNREQIINGFKTDMGRNVFLISLKAGGVGLNLTEAGYVFMLDPWWNAAAELQAVNRTHRIGQHKPVFSYKFITKDSIEEKILKLQEKKSLISAQFINDDNMFKELNLDDLKRLID